MAASCSRWARSRNGAIKSPVRCAAPAAQNQDVDLFVRLCSQLAIPCVRELQFSPPRKWRFDYAWPEQKVALEVQGGIWTRGRHVRGAALLREYDKLNAAAIAGWRVLFTTPERLMTDGILQMM